MKATVNTSLLQKSLQAVSVAAASGGFLPILSHVKIEAVAGKLTLSATNLDLFASDSIAAEVKEPGATTASLAMLLALTSRIQSTTVNLYSSKKTLEVSSRDVSAVLETLAADEFPATLEPNSKTEVECDIKELTEPFRMLAHAESTDAARYVLNGINIAPSKTGTDFAATSGSRMATFSGESKLSEIEAIIPDGFVRALLKLKPTGVATVKVSENAIGVAVNGTRLSGKLIEGKFPNYKPVIPKPGGNVLSCNREELIRAIQTCALFTNRELPGLRITGKGKELEVSKDAKAKATLLGTDLKGQPKFSIQFNSRHMLDALNVMSGDEVRIECNTERDPILIREKNFQSVMVPVTTKTA